MPGDAPLARLHACVSAALVSQACETRLWEVSALSASFNPSVAEGAASVVASFAASGNGDVFSEKVHAALGGVDEQSLVDTLRNATSGAVLDLLAYRPQPQTKSTKKSPSPEEDPSAAPPRLALNSWRFWQRNEASPEQRFIQKYFLVRRHFGQA